MLSWRWQITDTVEPDNEAWSRFLVAGRTPGEAFGEAVRQWKRGKDSLPGEVNGFVAPELPENTGKSTRYAVFYACKMPLGERV